MLVVLVATQSIGFVVLYLLLRRHLRHRAVAPVDMVELRSEVNGLLAELNGTAERNLVLLEDGIHRLEALLRRVDRHGADRDSADPDGADPDGAQPTPNDGTEGAADDMRAQVLRMRRLGFSPAAIAERLSTSRGEVELLVNLASEATATG